MKIELICIGDKPKSWLQEGVLEYQKRLHKHLNFSILGIKTSKNTTKETQGKNLINASQSFGLIIALDEHGKTQSSQSFSKHLKEWQDNGLSVCFLIGGSDGLSQECLNIAHHIWSLSSLTLPHMLTRLLVIEQLYRAQSLCDNHPYHRY